MSLIQLSQFPKLICLKILIEGYQGESFLLSIHKKLDLSGSSKKFFLPHAPTKCAITESTDITTSNNLISDAVSEKSRSYF
jgi:hypothetical protein